MISDLFLFFVAAIAITTSEAPPEACYLPLDVGYCNLSMRAWFYNKESRQCVSFPYGGCGGNENRFFSQEKCLHTCVCSQPADPGPCKAYRPKYFFNSETGNCERFDYGGCRGNANRFDTYYQCTQACVCSRPKKAGLYIAPSPSYYYDINTYTCEKFEKGGCRSNANRFATLEACNDACICSMKPDPGDCQSDFPVYFHNATSGTCEKFKYTGCGGNGNRFNTAETCTVVCRA